MSNILSLQQQLIDLLHPHIDGDTMRVDEVQGFMCALLSGPDELEAEQWLPEVLGDEQLFTASQRQQVAQCVTALSQHWREQLRARQLTLWLEETETGDVDYQTWANAYLFALDVVESDWFDVANDEDFEDSFYPMMVVAGVYDEEGIDISAKERAECTAQLAQSAELFYHYWQVRQRQPQTVLRAGDKIGRNDSCPCGSGKKYKHCCAQD